MEIRGVNGQTGPGPVGPVGAQKIVPEPAGAGSAAGAAGDQVQISPMARYLGQYNNLPAIRNDKVAEARQAVQNGTMDTDQKLSVAIDRMLNDLLGQ